MSQTEISYRVEPKENIYFAIKVAVSVAFYLISLIALVVMFALSATEVITRVLPLLIYVFLIGLFFFFKHVLLVGWIRGNAIRVSPTQFPDIYNIVVRQSQQLNMEAVPAVYILQAGGMLNAFATKLLGIGYVVIYSDVLEEAYNSNSDAVEFIIAHELGHIKHNHGLKRTLTLPSVIVPFLSSAYSRACEYTCDSIGAALCPRGAVSGLVMLASGRALRQRVNVSAYVQQDANETSFLALLAEKCSSHPCLPRRVARFQGLSFIASPNRKPTTSEVVDPKPYTPYVPTVPTQTAAPSEQAPVETTTPPADDYSRYMPK